MAGRATAHSTLATHLQLWLAAAYLAAAIGAVALVHGHGRALAREEARRRAELLVERDLAIHHYVNRELKPALVEVMGAPGATRRYDPRWMSSNYVVRRIDEIARDESDGGERHYDRESAIDARNPSSEADPYERAFIEDARRDPGLEARTTVRVLAGRAYLEVLHRGESIEPSCLRCHSVPSAAPAGLVERYGATRAFGRELGQLVSAVSVRVPLDPAYAAADAASLRLSLALLAVLAALFVAHLALQRRLLLAPLARLAQRAGDEAAREAAERAREAERRATALAASSAGVERTVRAQEQSRRVAALGRFAGGVAHEVNNVLTAVRGYAGLLLDALPDGDPRREDALEIRRACDRGAALGRQLHAFGHRDPGARRVLDPNRVVARVEETVRPLLPAEVRIVLDLAPDAAPVCVDPAELEQAVVALAVNARDALREGGRVVVRTRTVEGPLPEAAVAAGAPAVPGRWLVLSVADDGAALDAAALESAFDPFFPGRGREGARGLGLAAVEAMARAGGGAATVESAPGAGTTFRVWLPAAAGPVDEG